MSQYYAESDDKTTAGDKVLLKQALLGFISNLCVDPQLRAVVGGNQEGILDEVYQHFEKDLVQRQLLWQENISRELGILINIASDQSALEYFVGKGTVANLEKLIMSVQYKGEEIELVNRIMNLLAKLVKHASGQK